MSIRRNAEFLAERFRARAVNVADGAQAARFELPETLRMRHSNFSAADDGGFEFLHEFSPYHPLGSTVLLNFLDARANFVQHAGFQIPKTLGQIDIINMRIFQTGTAGDVVNVYNNKMIQTNGDATELIVLPPAKGIS